jgi:NAD(P)-dependent dehydrogenase (short-subunit alcohol dehydrogenase family)
MSSLLALVTGATSGIGLQAAIRLASSGYDVVAVGRDLDRLSALERAHPRIRPLQADLGDGSNAEDVFAEACGDSGLNLLVNAAGIIVSGPVGQTDLQAWDAVMNINVRAVYALSRAALPGLRQARAAGATAGIVNVSSVAGLRPFPGLSAYAVSKAAVDHLTRCMAIELAPEGIRVNAVNPGVVVTELHRRGGMSDDAYAAFLERGQQTHPLGRVGTPEEVAGLIAWLASDEASWMTGETIAIDGGRHLTALR